MSDSVGQRLIVVGRIVGSADSRSGSSSSMPVVLSQYSSVSSSSST